MSAALVHEPGCGTIGRPRGDQSSDERLGDRRRADRGRPPRRRRRAGARARRAGARRRPLREAVGLPRRARGRAGRRRSAARAALRARARTTSPRSPSCSASSPRPTTARAPRSRCSSRMRRHAEAAPIAERLGDTERAIDLYTRARKDLDAARLLEAAGRDRDAGRLLERALDLAAAAERAPIQLALGRILARRGAYPEADAPAPGRAQDCPRCATEAQRHLSRRSPRWACATARATRCSSCARADPTVPADLDSYLRDVARRRPPSARPARDREVIAGRYRLERLLGAGAIGPRVPRDRRGRRPRRSRSRCSSRRARAAARRTSGSCARRGSRARCATRRSSRSTTSRSSAASS